jgi:chemotaxis family two-component system response regulator Rcp1
MPSPVQVLLVEDHPADITLVRQAFRQITTNTVLHVVLDGHEALQYLRNEGRYQEVGRPDLILLDMTLPRQTGLEVLRAVHRDPVIRLTPIIVLTSSALVEDVRVAYTYCANSYLVKPTGPEEFLHLVQAIEAYWFNTALLPTLP